MKRCPFLIAASAVLAAALPASGHEGPDHVIEALTERIQAQGPTAKLLISRAYEHQSLGNWNAVLADFGAALDLDSRSRAALSGYTEASLQLGALPQAESMARRGLELDEDALGQSPFYALLARVFAEQQRWSDAREAWRGALRSPRPEIDWFLGEAECLDHLDRHRERVEALLLATERNPSVVLHRAWIHALVDAGDFETASQEIENGLSKSRWKSSWLLLRARIYAQRQLYTQQWADAADALTEIRSRLSVEHPDPHLVAEAAQALAFLGKNDEALAYIKNARDLGISESHLPEVTRIIESAPINPQGKYVE